MNIEQLNIKYKDLTPQQRIAELYKDFDVNKILYTSSFGTTAALLLKMIPDINPEQIIYFLDTTYHFIETIDYKEQLSEQLKLNVTEVLPEDWKNEFTQKDKTWTKDQDLCCSINKVEPMDKLKEGQDVWISGLLGYQNSHRKDLNVFEEKGGIIKFYPILDMTKEDVDAFFADNNIPKHPLEAQGFSSIGCAQCTVKGKGRSGRWSGSGKTECGLHL
jgi:phosphoadenosine phosphosulfate reductase